MSTKKEEKLQERILKRKADLSGKCPCCAERVNFYDEAKYVVKCHADFWTTHPELPFSNFTRIIAKRWACDECLRSKKAIKAYLLKQSLQYCHPEPYAAYFDRSITCRNCKDTFVFSKEEQKHWYETLQFKSWSSAVKCLSCRRSQRYITTRNAILSNLIPAFEAGDHSQLAKIVKAYLELDNVEAAKRFLGNAVRVCRKEEKLLAEVKRLRAELRT